MKHPTNSILSLCFLLLTCLNCSAGRTSGKALLKEQKPLVAVFDFEQEGFLAGEKLGGFAADELSLALFTGNNWEIIDRAQVKAATLQLNLETSALSVDQIKSFERVTRADLLILGKLIRLDANNFDPEKRDSSSIEIAFRLISAGDGSVVGMFSRFAKCKGELRKFLSEQLNRMSGLVRWQ